MSRTSIAMMLLRRQWERSERRIADRVLAAAAVVVLVDGVAADVDADTMDAVVDTAATAGMAAGGSIGPR